MIYRDVKSYFSAFFPHLRLSILTTFNLFFPALFSPALSFQTLSFPTLFFLLVTNTAADTEKFASIIIDDLGNSYEHGLDVIALPGAITLAILPKTIYAKELAQLAVNNHKEVMLHLPMQSVEHQKRSPGTLGLHMTHREFVQQLRLDLNAIPYVRGVNNHMGSLLTRHPGHMSWLMDELSRRGGLYFIDSKTTSKSIADKIAFEYRIPNLSRDFFLDPDYDEKTLRQQFDRFINKIKQRGFALAIAHPHPNTIQFLKQHLGELNNHGITLIPVSRLISTARRSTQQRGHNHVACTRPACSGL